MSPKEILLIAGDSESDEFAAELVKALREQLAKAEAGYNGELQPWHASLSPRFFGVGGTHMEAAGVKLLRQVAIERQQTGGPLAPLRVHRKFRALQKLAFERESHVIVFVGDFGLNLRLARAIKRYLHRRRGTFYNWEPIIVQLAGPKGWPTRAAQGERITDAIDCLLITDAEEKRMYAEENPNSRIEFIGETEAATDLRVIANRAARKITELLLEQDARFPLRAYLS